MIEIKNQISKLQKAQSGKGTKKDKNSVPAAFSLILHFNFYLAFER